MCVCAFFLFLKMNRRSLVYGFCFCFQWIYCQLINLDFWFRAWQRYRLTSSCTSVIVIETRGHSHEGPQNSHCFFLFCWYILIYFSSTFLPLDRVLYFTCSTCFAKLSFLSSVFNRKVESILSKQRPRLISFSTLLLWRKKITIWFLMNWWKKLSV